MINIKCFNICIQLVPWSITEVFKQKMFHNEYLICFALICFALFFYLHEKNRFKFYNLKRQELPDVYFFGVNVSYCPIVHVCNTKI